MSTLDALKTRIQKQVTVTRARLSEFFEGFDRHHTKRVTFSQAIRALNTFCAIDLNSDEVEALREYCTSDGYFQYKHFCDDIDSVFTLKGLERAPDTVPVNPIAGTRMREFGQELSPEEEEALLAIHDACRHAVQTRGVLVKTYFSDFDRSNSGFVSTAQFLREVRACFPFLTDGDVQVLLKRYGDGKDVHYRQLHIDVTDDAVAPGRTQGAGSGASGRRVLGGSGSGGVNVDDVEDRLIRQVATRRIRTKEFFSEFDSLRCGHITRAQFLRALYNCKFTDLSQAEMDAIADKYTNPARDAVRYVDFLDVMDEAFTKKGLEKAPTATLDSRAKTVALGPRRVAPALDPEAEGLLASTLGDIARSIAERRIALVPLFKDFDRSHEEYVSEAQFLRVLRTESLLPPSSAAQKVLLERFGGSGDRAGRVDYRSFVNIVDPPVQPRQEAPRRHYRPERKEADVAEVMHRIKTRVLKDKIRVEEFLRDFDKLRKGFVTKHQLEAGLSSASLRLGFEDIDALATAYADPRAVDSEGQPLVAWRRFADDVNIVFTTPGLELKPDADVDLATSMARTGAAGLPQASGSAAQPRPDIAGGARLTPAEEEQLRELLKDIEYRVNTRRLELTPGFQDFDRHNRGFVPKAQFARVLNKFDLGLSDAELDIVVRAFRVPASDRVDVNYKWFIGAIDEVDGFVGNLPGAHEPPTVAGATARRLGGAGPAYPSASRRSMPDVSSGSTDSEEALAKLQSQCLRNGLKMKDFLVDYDRLRSGHVPAAKFRTALASAKIELTPPELAALEKEYACIRVPGHVNWRDMSYDVDGGNEALEKAPTATLSRKVGSRTTAVLGTSAVPEDALAGLLGDVASTVRTRRINLKPIFQDFDPLRHSHVTKNRFTGILLGESLVKSPKAAATIAKAFEVVGFPDKVNYGSFLLSVDTSLLQ